MDTNRNRSATHGQAPRFAAEEATGERRKWESIAAQGLPTDWGVESLPRADEIAFALGQLQRTDEARSLLERAFGLEPTHRRASSIAYLHYDALLRHKVRKPRLSEPELHRREFERWIAEALRMRPDSIVDHYRLGVYHASIQTAKDVAALRAFRQAIALFEKQPAALQVPQSRLWKTYIRTLYGAARSAFRLDRFEEARRWIFRCIRLDTERHHMEPVFKLFLAAKILVAENRLADAERGLRLALEAPHRGDRDFVYALLAEIALAQERIEDAASWIELHIPAHRRKPYVWRLLGDCEARRGRRERALTLYKSALLKDHGGRHLTLLRIGRIEEEAGRLREARRAYEQATDSRRRRYLSEDPTALEGLARVCAALHDDEALARARARLEEGRRPPKHAGDRLPVADAASGSSVGGIRRGHG